MKTQKTEISFYNNLQQSFTRNLTFYVSNGYLETEY